MFVNQRTVSSAPSAPMNQKQLCHPKRCSRLPKMGAKIGNAKYCDELKIADARPRSEVGNHAATMRPLPGNTGDCASPERILKTKIAVNAALALAYPAKPVRNAKTDQRMIA